MRLGWVHPAACLSFPPGIPRARSFSPILPTGIIDITCGLNFGESRASTFCNIVSAPPTPVPVIMKISFMPFVARKRVQR